MAQNARNFGETVNKHMCLYGCGSGSGNGANDIRKTIWIKAGKQTVL